MAFSRKSKITILVPLLALIGCATSSYHVLYQDDSGAELSITPNRVLLECEDLADADEKGLYGFMVHALDEQNTVITLAQSNTLDREGCQDRLKNIQKILNGGTKIYIAARGNLNDADGIPQREYNFPNIGSFKSNGRSLEFVAISNEYGLCYSAHRGFQVKPCPPKPFPLWKKK